MADARACDIAFEGGAIDAIVDDWIVVARARAAGRDRTFIARSTAVGGILAPPASDASTPADLDGPAVGVAGGPLDESRPIPSASAAREGLDLAAAAERIYGAPPLIPGAARGGDVSALVDDRH